jgi:hypothetical protein
MKRTIYLLTTACIIGLGWMMQSCEADVDLNNVDTSIEVDANIATPVGSMHATLGDFVGNGTWGLFTEDGKLTFKDTFSIERKFHKLDLSQYISDAQLNMDVYKNLNLGAVGGLIVTPPDKDQHTKLEFNLTMTLKGINDTNKIKTQHQRLDRAFIKNASFISNISRTGGLPLEWEWIDSVTIDMDSAFFHREAGNVVKVYSRGDNGGYGKNMTINVDEFMLDLMTNPNPSHYSQYWSNVKDFCQFRINMYITIPRATTLQVPANAGFQYNLGVQFIDYHAVWGMFEPSADMSDENEVVIADEWGPWKDFQSAKLPFANPRVDLQITTQIAGALKLTGNYLYTANNSEQIYALFDGSKTLYRTFSPEEYLPLTSQIGESKTMHYEFSKEKDHGQIDRLFSIHPEKLGYKFQISFDESATPQIRITDNTSIHVDAVCTLPFEFNEGVVFDYSDTIKGIDLSMLNLDTLLADVDIIDTLEKASATLALTFINDIPFQIKGVFTCLDENNNVIIDPKTEKPFLITENDTVLIPSPKYTYSTSTWIPEAVKLTEMIHVDREDLPTLRAIKSIAFYALLDDKSLSDVFEQAADPKVGDFTTKLTDGEGLRIKIAVGANAEAILNFDSSDNK